MKGGVPFKRFQKVVGKLPHAAIGIPQEKGLFGPVNRVLSLEPKTVFWDRCPAAKTAFQDWRQLILEAAMEPTSVNELVPGEAVYKGTLDASRDGAGGAWVHGTKEIAPIVWRVKFPPEVAARLVTQDNPNGDITNLDLEMVAEILG